MMKCSQFSLHNVLKATEIASIAIWDCCHKALLLRNLVINPPVQAVRKLFFNPLVFPNSLFVPLSQRGK